MPWKVIVDDNALKVLKKTDRPTAFRIIDFVENRLAVVDNPRSLSAALQGSELRDFWKYRVGDYRIIVSIHDAELVINVIRVGNRKEVYR